jgi:hypothetical protein
MAGCRDLGHSESLYSAFGGWIGVIVFGLISTALNKRSNAPNWLKTLNWLWF